VARYTEVVPQPEGAMANDEVFEYEGTQVDVDWDERLCIHIGECGRADDELFVAGRKPWCQPDLADTERLLEVVKRCPTGALTARRKDGAPTEAAPEENRAIVSNDGPVYLTGDLSIEGAPDDMPGVRFRAALCRCGHSKNKPFCDNAHQEAGFRDGGAVGSSGEPLAESGGPLDVKPMPNGPLLVTGNLEIVAASGRVAWQGTRTALCRCGHSKNKPFCDGAHVAAGFEPP
jgi:CDGSH-type Zn-finger protein/uncharacterized Fe-S cluster protein YjdI